LKNIKYKYNSKKVNRYAVYLAVLSILIVPGKLFSQEGITKPFVDGLFYGDPDGSGDMTPDQDKYLFLSDDSLGGLATLWYYLDADTLYLAVVVDSVNDNVFDESRNQESNPYVGTAGWGQYHSAEKLIGSDHMQITFQCGLDEWFWKMDYAYDLDEDDDPYEADWLSGLGGKDALAAGDDDPDEPTIEVYPGFLESSSSFAWNMNNSLWDVTLGGTRTNFNDWKSPDGTYSNPPTYTPNADDDVQTQGYSEFHWDDVNKWEWSMVYEMKLNISSCSSAPIVIWPWKAHNSPAKYLGENIPFKPDTLRDLGDLPISYGTLLIDNGPEHYIVPRGPFLGTIVDSDTNGTATTDCLGDDTADSTDDEDGLVTEPIQNWTNGTVLNGYLPDGTEGSVTMDNDTYGLIVKATNNTLETAQVVGWIDWNVNGILDDPEERSEIITDGSTGNVPSGSSNVDVIVYWDGVSKIQDQTYARFRITTDPLFKSPTSPSPLGLAIDGEVEDYLIPEGSLPVTLTSFSANATLQGVLCKWTTESETENLGFIIERKEQDTNWIEIASYKTDNGLLGQGTTSSYTDYEYLDAFVEPNTTYEYRLADVDYNGIVAYHSARKVKVVQTPLPSIIDDFTILTAYPNPFNPSTTIRYGLDADSHVKVEIYEITGQLITTLLNIEQTQGWHSVVWNGTNQRGEQAPAGPYLSRIVVGNEVKTTKLMLLR